MSQFDERNAAGAPALNALARPAGRREFLKWTGVGALGLAVAACDEATRTISEVTPPDTVEVTPPPPTYETVTLDFSSDVGVLNYAYALEQLEAAFYTQVVGSANFGTLYSDDEKAVLKDLRDHEIAHRELFKAALASKAIAALTPNFTSVNLNSRLSVLQAAQAFEDLGVAAYNGGGRYLSSADYLTLAGKIVSVEARHASVIRSILAPETFAPSAFDPALPPSQVLSVVAPYIHNTVNVTNLPAGA